MVSGLLSKDIAIIYELILMEKLKTIKYDNINDLYNFIGYLGVNE
jgi:hypothetical protein